MTQDDISLFLVLLVELQIEIQYNTIYIGGGIEPDDRYQILLAKLYFMEFRKDLLLYETLN